MARRLWIASIWRMAAFGPIFRSMLPPALSLYHSDRLDMHLAGGRGEHQ